MMLLCDIFWIIATANFAKPKINTIMTTPTPETGRARHNPNPYNTQVPVVGKSVHTPLETPIGVQPHYLPKDENWPWVYGS
jgi:hypothetical protein